LAVGCSANVESRYRLRRSTSTSSATTTAVACCVSCNGGGRQRHPWLTKRQTAEKARAEERHIDNRPAAANIRSELGHWERDCIVGKHGHSALLVAADRKSRCTKVSRVSRTTAKAVSNATLRMLAGLPVASMTNDNGSEFARPKQLEERLGARMSSPWQRGTVENINGLIRQYVPKKTDIDHIDSSLPKAIEETLNHRPRKVLGYRTPHEVFFDEETTLMTRRKRVHFGLEFTRAQPLSPILVGLHRILNLSIVSPASSLGPGLERRQISTPPSSSRFETTR
jgi:transposase, IS30 family